MGATAQCSSKTNRVRRGKLVRLHGPLVAELSSRRNKLRITRHANVSEQQAASVRGEALLGTQILGHSQLDLRSVVVATKIGHLKHHDPTRVRFVAQNYWKVNSRLVYERRGEKSTVN